MRPLKKLWQRRATMPPPLFGVLFIPSGMCQGFVSVVLGFILSQHGVGVADIAALVGLRLLPETWMFLSGPLIDSCLTCIRWYIMAIAGLILCFVGFAFLPLGGADLGLLGALCLSSGITAVLSVSAASAMLPLTTVDSVRGACAGWRQACWLGGIGLGGGGALWLATHAGGLATAALVSAAVFLLCLFPFSIVKVPAVTRGTNAVAAGRAALVALWKLMRTRPGLLAAIAVTLPAGLGAAAYLMPAVAGDWRASADVVATVTGALSGIASMPGCITSGYLCDRFPRRTVFIWCALAGAVAEALVTLAPHSAAGFAAIVLVNSAFTGLAYGSVLAVIYEQLESVGAATVNGVLGSLCNVPVIVVTMILGAVQARAGSGAMLLTEAGLGVVSIALYTLLVLAWRPAAVDPLLQPIG
jgi:MFS transporter, PAT family, beta-lactamase induction signal transducer AmpG